MKKHTTTINEIALKMLGLTRDEYALCDYIQFRLADPRGKSGGWCFDTKQEIAEFVGITRPGLYKMVDRLEAARLLETDPTTGFARVTGRWIDTVSECKQSLQGGVNKVYTECKQSLQRGVNKVTHIKEEKENKKEKTETEEEEKSAAAGGVQLPVEAQNPLSPPIAPAPPSPANPGPHRWDTFTLEAGATDLLKDALCYERYQRESGKRTEADYAADVQTFTTNQRTEVNTYNTHREFRSHFFNWVSRRAAIARDAAKVIGTSSTAQMRRL